MNKFGLRLLPIEILPKSPGDIAGGGEDHGFAVFMLIAGAVEAILTVRIPAEELKEDGGKGGGRDVSARAIFDNEENAMLFADLLSKHLR